MSSQRLSHGGRDREVRLEGGTAILEGRRIAFERRGEGRIAELLVDGKAHRTLSVRDGDRAFVWLDGKVYVFGRARAGRGRSVSEHAGDLLSPMPGRVRKTLVAAGDSVRRGQPLLVLEAMKMEHSIRAPRDGAVKRLLVREGDLVDAGVELAEISS